MRGVGGLAALLLLLASACVHPEPRRMEPFADRGKSDTAAQIRGGSQAPGDSQTAARPARSLRRTGRQISVNGELVEIGVPVLLWYDEGGYNGYRTQPHFSQGGPVGLRYRPGRGSADTAAADVLATVDQFVLHYDACGLSRECFRVLHDQRELSVHFLLDVDGTVYQTLDVKETAWHARQANVRSVGVEIANVGAYREGDTGTIARWYGTDDLGVRLEPPRSLGSGGVRTPGFVARPVRPALVRGRVQGKQLLQYDFTREQYTSLVALTAGLVGALPELELRVPRETDGSVLGRALTSAEFESFQGILGHYHVSVEKVDPGPAFQWEPYLEDVREALAAGAP